MANKRVLKVRRQTLVACLSCSLCAHLLLEATAISLCLHSFCRSCIYKKLSDDKLNTCPVCDIDLGCNPVDKLRADHSLQYIREKVFSVDNRKVEAPEAVPLVPPPSKRKERLLSSLVGTPELLVNTSAEGRGYKETTQDGKEGIQSATAPCMRKRSRLLDENTKTTLKSSTLMPVAARHDLKNVPIWLSLAVSEYKEGAAHLPQLSPVFLRIKDRGIPVSVIQKYIAKRLELLTGDEVQIMFQCQPVLPSLELGELFMIWRKSPLASRMIKTRVGSSGKDYVMMLKYCRKGPAQTPLQTPQMP